LSPTTRIAIGCNFSGRALEFFCIVALYARGLEDYGYKGGGCITDYFETDRVCPGEPSRAESGEAGMPGLLGFLVEDLGGYTEMHYPIPACFE
jgi:hypothetical protein